MLRSLTDSRGVATDSPSKARTWTLLLQRNTGPVTATVSTPRNTDSRPALAALTPPRPRVQHGSKGHSSSGFHQSFHHVCGFCGGPVLVDRVRSCAACGWGEA